MEKNFSELYTEIKNESSTIVEIPEKLSSSIDHSIVEYEKMDVLIFCIATFSAIVLFATAPACFFHYYGFSISIEPLLNNYLSQVEYINSNVYVSISSFFVLFSVPFYTLVIPFSPEMSLIKKNFMYFGYALILNYLVLLIPIMYIVSYDLLSESMTTNIIIFWLSFPGIFIALIPTFSIMLFMAIFLDEKKVKNNKSHLLSDQILYELALLLKDINQYKQQNASSNTKQKLTKKLNEVSSLIASMAVNDNNSCTVNDHVNKRFLEASKAVSSLQLCILLPKGNSQKLLKRKVESLFNIFATGNYMDLPKIPYISYSHENTPSKISIYKRVITLFSIAVFFVIPLVLWAVLSSFYKSQTPVVIQSMLPVLYSVWCLIGIITFSEKLAPDTKIMVFYVFKLLLSKK